MSGRTNEDGISMTEFATYLPGFIAAYSILLVGASSPGPSVAMLIGIATSEGRAPALIATLGIALGSVTINILTMLGIGLILSQAAWGMSALRIIGSAYLLWLAYGAFKKVPQPPHFQLVATSQRTPLRHFLAGYLLQVTNPKTIAFWVAIASIGATDGAGAGIIALFVAGAFLISFMCHGAWAVALSASPIRVAYASARRWIEATLGGILSFAAYKLATSES